MIDLRKKMIFAAGAREGRAQLTVTERAAECCDTPDNPEHEQDESGMEVLKLKTEAREHAGANNVGNDDRRGGVKADGSPWGLCFHRNDVGWGCGLMDNSWHDT